MAEAERLYQELEAHTGVAVAVVDDACYERTEAMVAIMADEFGVAEERLGRAIVVNREKGKFLFHEKPLARGDSPLKKWFDEARAAGALVKGNTFESEGLQFVVDDFGALRCSAIPQIYFDDNPTAFWGIGHAAPMVDDFVIDPAVGKGLLSFREWQEALNLDGLIALRGSARGIPELDPTALDEKAFKLAAQTARELSLPHSADGREALSDAASEWSREDRRRFFNHLFQAQIEDGAVLPYSLWSPLFPGPLTFRGEVYGEPDRAIKQEINSSFDAPWSERKVQALEILVPFRAFRSLIERGY